MTRIARYRLNPRAWRRDLKLRIAVLADFHACWPWMTPARIARICGEANALAPDLTLLLGDYVEGMKRLARPVKPADWAAAIAALEASLGVHAILGIHDWWEDETGQATLEGPILARRALEAVGIPVYENDAVRLDWRGEKFWLAGVADQRPLRSGDRGNLYEGPKLDDLSGTLAKVSDAAPVILMAHEPDIFPEVPDRVALTLAGHTHAGQFRFFGFTRWTSSRYGDRFGYGHVNEGGRDLIVSAGLGNSVLPFRIGAPPEIVLVELGGGNG
ncbi:MAG: metallophosphoesterase [Cucumibacter sp.]